LYQVGYKYKSLYYGGKTEIGFTQDLNNFRFGLVGSYMFNISATVAVDVSSLTLRNETFLTTLSLGYAIK
jgi:hypothetical protein